MKPARVWAGFAIWAFDSPADPKGPLNEEAGPLGTGRLRASGEEVLL